MIELIFASRQHDQLHLVIFVFKGRPTPGGGGCVTGVMAETAVRHSWQGDRHASGYLQDRTASRSGRRSHHKSADASAEPLQRDPTSATASLHLCLCDILLAVMIDMPSQQHEFVVTFVLPDSWCNAVVLSCFIATAVGFPKMC